MVSLAGAKAAASSLVHWDSPVASGGTLAAVLAVLVSICYYSLISVAAYISLTLLVLVLGIKIYSYAMVFMKKVSGEDILKRVTEVGGGSQGFLLANSRR